MILILELKVLYKAVQIGSTELIAWFEGGEVLVLVSLDPYLLLF